MSWGNGFPGGGGASKLKVHVVSENVGWEIIDPLSTVRYDGGAATDTNGFVIFAGGYASAYKNEVDRYDLVGNRNTLANMSARREYFMGVNDANGDCLFGGGGDPWSASIDKYDASGIRTNYTPLSAARMNMSCAKDGAGNVNYGGGSDSGYIPTGAVDRFDPSGVRTTKSLSNVRLECGVGVDGNGFVLFAGGYIDYNSYYSMYATVDRFDTFGTLTTLTNLSQARANPKGASNGNGDVFFAGGTSYAKYPNPSTSYAIVDKYDKSGARTTATSLGQIRTGMSSVTDKNGTALYIGGTLSNGNATDIIEGYDNSGARTTFPPLLVAAYRMSSALDGNGCILCGLGRNDQLVSPGYLGTVQRYNVPGKKTLYVPPYNAYKFQEDTQEHPAVETETRILVNSPNEGYFRQVNAELTY